MNQNMLDVYQDRGDNEYVARIESCCAVPPPAIPLMTAVDVKVQVFGLTTNADARLVVYKQSTVLLERQLETGEIATGTINIQMPAVSEGMVTFLLIAEGQGTHTTFYNVPCCVAPPEVVQDFKTMFSTMCSVARESDQLPHHAITSNEATLVWVWKEHFCSFLEDVDKLFEQDGLSKISESMVMKIFTNMFQECCRYNAWELAAYMLTKAAEQGIKILMDPSLATTNNNKKKITAEILKAALQIQGDDGNEGNLIKK